MKSCRVRGLCAAACRAAKEDGSRVRLGEPERRRTARARLPGRYNLYV